MQSIQELAVYSEINPTFKGASHVARNARGAYQSWSLDKYRLVVHLVCTLLLPNSEQDAAKHDDTKAPLITYPDDF